MPRIVFQGGTTRGQRQWMAVEALPGACGGRSVLMISRAPSRRKAVERAAGDHARPVHHVRVDHGGHSSSFLRLTDLRVAQPTIVCRPSPRQSGGTTWPGRPSRMPGGSGSSRSLTARSHAIPAVRSGARCLRSAHLRKIPTVRRTAPHSTATAPSASILVNTSSRVPAGLSP